eukprot:Gregarina_sp_Poly_1__6703@NODE_3609_length_980_cov_8_603505_g2296_i0_p1_GENE_NODE_3609_length_980_cov_8_603505_g2296_i0NODE_3609_length_980_cov_8_603505_g2296_i0_p1_ORF_typecomplete_len188_score26_52_NODE_3609_length_980_cov_8_603505_g2296_i054617
MKILSLCLVACAQGRRPTRTTRYLQNSPSAVYDFEDSAVALKRDFVYPRRATGNFYRADTPYSRRSSRSRFRKSPLSSSQASPVSVSSASLLSPSLEMMALEEAPAASERVLLEGPIPWGLLAWRPVDPTVRTISLDNRPSASINSMVFRNAFTAARDADFSELLKDLLSPDLTFVEDDEILDFDIL